GIENLLDHKVKRIRYDNETEFKNREMNQFCEMKGILRQYSVARTPQQNGVAKRRNRTLIEVDSKLPTTFWAEAVNTACYVQNRMCPVTILNTIDHLSKFDGKADEDSGPDWLFDIDALTRTMNYEPIVAGTQSNGFVDSKSSHDNGFKPSSDNGKKVNEDLRKNSESKDQEKEDNVNSTNTINTASTNEVNAVNDGAEADKNNLDITIQVSLIPTTRIHKDHPLDQVIGDLQSATQTKKMSKNLKEHGFVSTIQQRTNHKDL
ncbi:putative ribonuclease H-like domain-containing protein, partial [Tanacetum coccineum]